MKKLLTILTLVILISICAPIKVEATSGRLRADSITTYNGVTYGQHGDGHWHVAVLRSGYYYASGSELSSIPYESNNTQSSTSKSVDSTSSVQTSSTQTTYSNEQEVIKSNDNSIKSLKIDNKEIELNWPVSYETENEKVTILVITNDEKATYEVEDENLNIGDNLLKITVTAENGEIKEYDLNITRIEKVEELSSNTDVEIVVNNEEIIFNKFNETAEISVSSSVGELKFKYKLVDENASIDVENYKNLKEGSNEVIFKITAEDGNVSTYTLTVNKASATTEVVEFIIGSGMCVIIIFGIYYLVKKSKVNKK